MNALRYPTTSTPRQPNEKARLRVIQGPDQGATFILVGSRVTMGRGGDNDVVLSDNKASRRHAEIFYAGESWQIRDLGSSNGVFFKGESLRASKLLEGDRFTIGDSTFQFLTANTNTTLLQNSVALDAMIGPRTQIKNYRDDRLNRLTALPKIRIQGTSVRGSGGDKTDFKKITIALILGCGVWFLVDSSGPALKKLNKARSEVVPVRDLASFLPDQMSSESNRTADTFFKSGFRDYREKNYLRAKLQFETILQVNPYHKLARIYLENCKQAIQEEVKEHLSRGGKALLAGKLIESKGHFEAIQRLLYRDKTHAAYKEANDQLEKIRKTLDRSAS